MAASITDVAKRADVSVATVSRALRGLPNVAPQTRRRVLEAAEALDYVADLNASRLAAGRTLSIGLLVVDLGRWFTSQVVAGAEAIVAAAGYDVVLYQTRSRRDGQRFLSPAAYRKRVDGLLALVPTPPTGLAEGLRTDGLPLVTVSARWPGFDWVGVDDRAAAATATRHLLNLGHRRIGLIGDDREEGDRQAAERRAGYHDVLAAAGVAADLDLDVPGGFTARGGAEAMASLLAVDRPPTAIFAMSDEMALGAIRTIRAAGLRVPEDVSVIGFDDQELATASGLTTMHNPAAQLGEAAAGLLVEHLTTGDGEPAPRSVTMHAKLQVRTTTGPSRLADVPAVAPR
jgi:LacI family transcriptional regulator, repressor for deo operon, udp, cdd, tsx, nupC, and nupG